MPLLFSYGTLQQQDVQHTTFGRLLEGTHDELAGFERTLVKIEDPQAAADLGETHHVSVRANGRNNSRVAGTLFEIDDADLTAADAYERPADYHRILVTLVSGRQAWVYVHGSSLPQTL